MNDNGVFETLVKESVKQLTNAIKGLDIPDTYNDSKLVEIIDSLATVIAENLSDHTRELGRCADALEEANKLKKRKLFK